MISSHSIHFKSNDVAYKSVDFLLISSGHSAGPVEILLPYHFADVPHSKAKSLDGISGGNSPETTVSFYDSTRTAMTSISTRAFSASLETSTVDRAGGLLGKY